MKSTPIRCRSVPVHSQYATANSGPATRPPLRPRVSCSAPRPIWADEIQTNIDAVADCLPKESTSIGRPITPPISPRSSGQHRKRVLPCPASRTYLADEICTNLDTWTGSLPKESTSIGQTVTQIPQPMQDEFELSRIS